ncbi:MAG: poly(3-hydroxyalkanoate) granule-associated protein PhaI, partial [Chloroflexi bacterium]
VEEKAEEIGEGLESRIERVLARMNLPSRREIQALSQKLDELSEKLDRLTEAK